MNFINLSVYFLFILILYPRANLHFINNFHYLTPTLIVFYRNITIRKGMREKAKLEVAINFNDEKIFAIELNRNVQ